jgi:hypothetical protein
MWSLASRTGAGRAGIVRPLTERDAGTEMANEAADRSSSEIEKFLQQWAPSKKETGYAELLRQLNLRLPEIVERAKTAPTGEADMGRGERNDKPH